MKKLSKRFIKSIDKKLRQLKEEYTTTLKREVVSQDSADHLDRASTLQSQEMSTRIRKKMQNTLPEIELALRKIQLGTYGICEHTGQMMDMRRLKAIPWARYNIT